jgi:peptidase E
MLEPQNYQLKNYLKDDETLVTGGDNTKELIQESYSILIIIIISMFNDVV